MPNLWTPYFKKGIVFGAQNKFEQAEKNYKIGFEIYPDNPSLLASYGATLVFLGKFNKAEPLLRSSIRQWPTNPNSYNALAQIYLRQNKNEQARKLLLLAVAVNRNFGIGHANLAMLYAMMDLRDLAQIHLKKALELGVSSPMMDNLKIILQDPIPEL
jgi:tetratricopeptide (TPR) repeat protein